MLTRGFSDGSYGLITVMEVRMTPDLKIAKVYVSIFGNPEVRTKTLKKLEEHRPEIRHSVGAHVRLKFTPEIHFYLDETMDRVDRINTLINEIHKNDGKH